MKSRRKKQFKIILSITWFILAVSAAYADPSANTYNFQQQPGSAPYMTNLQRRIKRGWFPPSGQESRPVTVSFKVHSQGEMSDLRIEISSGLSSADQAALQAVTNAAPFSPLPVGSPAVVPIEFKFDYNTGGPAAQIIPMHESGFASSAINPSTLAPGGGGVAMGRLAPTMPKMSPVGTMSPYPIFAKPSAMSLAQVATISPTPTAMPHAIPVAISPTDLPPVAPQIHKRPANGEFESYEYPYIKWKPKLLPTGALVQLETTLQGSNTGFRSRGIVKYKVIALVRGRAFLPAQGLRFELIDDKGFGLGKFMAPASEFGVITGTTVLEARGTAGVSEDDYDKAVDYSVK